MRNTEINSLLFYSFRVIYVTTKKRKVGTEMEIKFNATGAMRKELVKAAGEITGCDPVYKGAPTFAYEIGSFFVDKDGTLIFGDTDSEQAERLVEGLGQRGFAFEKPCDGIVIEIPLEGFTDIVIENLRRIIASKESLIKKAIGANELPIEQTDTALKFPWLKFDADSETVAACSRFICALCAAAKEQKRVNAKEKPVENEKFAFRVFLIRLGFVGNDYKAARKILLKNLGGNAAFKNGAPTKAEASANE